ncbi:MAG: VPS10 domain-containing protein, partial [Bacteroidia bacterium]
MIRKILSVLTLSISTFIFSQQPTDVKLTGSMFGAIGARQIGPAEMSGRITSIDVVNSTPRIFYVGTAGGGVWKTTTAGVTFNPVFDKFSQSIGCLTIDQKNPETVWVGTGECNMRNSVSVGTGLYKTTDGGTTWMKSGLDSCERISKIVIHPKDSNTIFAAVPGALWSDSKHRGLYKTTDGGKTWNKIYYVDEKTGCADFVINPKNPDIMYMSTWQFRRTPWSFTSGGKTSALYKSTDGGKSWRKIHNGITGDTLGRICIAVAPSAPDNVYAIAESKNTGLYKSTDGGETWARKGGSMNVTWRPFYFSVIVVD